MLNGSELDHGNGLDATRAVFTVEQAVKETATQHKTSRQYFSPVLEQNF
jgi:hypothetical protein